MPDLELYQARVDSSIPENDVRPPESNRPASLQPRTMDQIAEAKLAKDAGSVEHISADMTSGLPPFSDRGRESVKFSPVQVRLCGWSFMCCECRSLSQPIAWSLCLMMASALLWRH